MVKAFLFLSGLKVYEQQTDSDGAKWYTHKSVRKPFLIDPDKFSDMVKRVEYLLSPGEFHPIKWIRKAKARHFRLYNASFEEYLMAENYYFAFVEKKEDFFLDCLIACLYRRPWHRWNASKIQKRAKAFRKVKPEIKNAVFMWYVGFRAYVPKRCPNLFSGKKSNRPFHPREYINGMIHQLNNGDITIKDKLLKRPVWDALDELEQRAIDYEMSKPEK